MKKAFDTSLEGKIIEKINELYISERKKYLVLVPSTIKDDNGKKIASGKYFEKHLNQEKFTKLSDFMIKKHLRGKETIGVFSGDSLGKFLCYDLDFPDDKLKLKWIYRHLINALNELGINNKYIHTSFSGSKGYHVEIFIDEMTELENLVNLFNLTMIQIKLNMSDDIKFIPYSNKEHYGEFEFGKIEMRPTHSQGVKIPLGINFNNQNYKANKCTYLDVDTLEPLSDDYILSIEPLERHELLNILEDANRNELLNEDIVGIKNNIKEPHSHKLNKDEDVTIDHIVDLINNGLKMSGTRHISCFKIAKYFRYCGHEVEVCIQLLKDWMMTQDKKYYKTPLNEALSECERISKLVYQKEYNLLANIKNICIYKSELNEIIKIKNKNDKLIIYSMLIHSKRFALKNGVFYMTFKQIKEMSDIGMDGALASIKRLENSGLIEVVSRNVRQDNSYKSKPNKYRINLNVELDEVILEIDNSKVGLNYTELYLKSIINNFTNDELKHLPTRQYREITQLRNKLVG